LTELNPADNPYLHWILTGTHGPALPLALRAESFDVIRTNLDRLEWHQCSIEQYLEANPAQRFHRFNLSDIFEYMSADRFQQLLELLTDRAMMGGRLAYWNMLAPRSRPAHMANRLHPLVELASNLHQQDKAFFYSALVVEEVIGC
jgi:S-adenosylmethionine-diacylglycerol 3-amino-3-carboxypropyl transferase